jgi:hypothetical protein
MVKVRGAWCEVDIHDSSSATQGVLFGKATRPSLLSVVCVCVCVLIARAVLQWSPPCNATKPSFPKSNAHHGASTPPYTYAPSASPPPPSHPHVACLTSAVQLNHGGTASRSLKPITQFHLVSRLAASGPGPLGSDSTDQGFGASKPIA